MPVGGRTTLGHVLPLGPVLARPFLLAWCCMHHGQPSPCWKDDPMYGCQTLMTHMPLLCMPNKLDRIAWASVMSGVHLQALGVTTQRDGWAKPPSISRWLSSMGECALRICAGHLEDCPDKVCASRMLCAGHLEDCPDQVQMSICAYSSCQIRSRFATH
jgi:hypothetical protein